MATVIAQVGASALSLGSVVVVGRTLGQSGRGTVALLTTVGFVTSWLSTMGVDQAISNMAGRQPWLSRALAGSSVLLATVFGGLACVLVLGVGLAIPQIEGHAPKVLFAAVMVSVPVLILQIYGSSLL